MKLRTLKLSQLRLPPPAKRRKHKWEFIGLLADNIAEHGLMSPLMVCKSKSGKTYRIICGVARYRALKLLGNTTAMCEVYSQDPGYEYLTLICPSKCEPIPMAEVGRKALAIQRRRPDLSLRKIAYYFGLSATHLRRCIEAAKVVDKSKPAT